MLYRGMDRAQLDAAYNNSAAVENYDAIKADWHTRSVRVRQSRRGHFDLAYGDAPRQRLDLFLADNPRAPTFMFIHGGYWQRNDKEDHAFLAEGLLAHGINLAVVEYTLAPEAHLDHIVGEIRRAIAWLAEHLSDLGADPARLYVGGHSAGGHLTASAMSFGFDAVKGGLAISGLYDLEPIRLNYLNVKLGLDTEGARRNSPILCFPLAAAPLVVAYGSAELPELCRQSVDYANGWLQRGLPGRLLAVDGADHFTILESLANPDGVLTRELVKMVAT